MGGDRSYWGIGNWSCGVLPVGLFFFVQRIVTEATSVDHIIWAESLADVVVVAFFG